MSITIIATVGSADANSFATEAQYIARAATKLSVPTGTTVTGATITEPEKKALLEATREVSRLMFVGSRVDTTQVLSHPRAYLPNPDAPWITQSGDAATAYYAEDVIADRVVDATIDLALLMLAQGANILAVVDSTQSLIEKTIGPIKKVWTSPPARPVGLGRYPEVMASLAPLLESRGGALTLERA